MCLVSDKLYRHHIVELTIRKQCCLSSNEQSRPRADLLVPEECVVIDLALYSIVQCGQGCKTLCGVPRAEICK